MSLYDGSRFRGRFVDIAGDGLKLFAVACGESVCTGTKFNGRFAAVNNGDFGDGVKIFATASEGCQPPLDPFGLAGIDETCNSRAEVTAAFAAVPFLVEADALPPYGLSRVIRVRIEALLLCPEKDCLTAYLIYDEGGAITETPCGSLPAGRKVWFGCVGNVDIHLWIDPAADPEERIKVCLSGCMDDDPHSNGPHDPIVLSMTEPDCTLNWTDSVSPGEIFVRGCCEFECADDALFWLRFHFLAFCGSFRMGRFVEVAADGKKVFAVSDCNSPADCTPTPQSCCTPLANCNLTLTVPSGTFAGTYTLLPDNHTPPYSPPLGWVSNSFTPCGTPALQFHFEAVCIPHPTDPTKTIFQVNLSGGGVDCNCNSGVGGGTAEVEVDFPCFPLEVEGVIGPFDCTTNPDPPCTLMCLDGDDIIPFILTL